MLFARKYAKFFDASSHGGTSGRVARRILVGVDIIQIERYRVYGVSLKQCLEVVMNGIDVVISSAFNFVGLYPKSFFVFSSLLSWGAVWMLALQLLSIKQLAASASLKLVHFLFVFSGFVVIVTHVPMAVFLCWGLSQILNFSNYGLLPSFLIMSLLGFITFLAGASSMLSVYFKHRIVAVKSA